MGTVGDAILRPIYCSFKANSGAYLPKMNEKFDHKGISAVEPPILRRPIGPARFHPTRYRVSPVKNWRVFSARLSR